MTQLLQILDPLVISLQTNVLPIIWNQVASLVTPVAEDVSPWLPSVWNLAIWVAIGLFLDQVVLRLLLKAAEKTPWEFDDAFLRCFFGKTFLLFALFGLDTAAALLPDEPVLKIITSAKPVAHKLFVSLDILVISWLISDLVIGFVKILAKRVEALPSTSIFHNIIRITIMSVGILVLLQTLGISILPILTALGVGGLAISLALKDTLENIFAGFQIIFSKQIRLGDYVKLDTGVEGYAEDIGWRNSIIKQPNDNLVIMPNAKLASSVITNYSRPSSGMAVMMDGIVNHYSDLAMVESIVTEAAQRVIDREEIANKKLPPRFRMYNITDVGVRYRVFANVLHHKNEYILLSAMIKEVTTSLREAGVLFSNVLPAPPPAAALPDEPTASLSNGGNNSTNGSDAAASSDHATDNDINIDRQSRAADNGRDNVAAKGGKAKSSK